MEQAGGPLSGKGNREELVTWVSSVGLSLCVSKMELSGTLGQIPRESVERAGDMGQPWRTRVRGAGDMEGGPLPPSQWDGSMMDCVRSPYFLSSW